MTVKYPERAIYQLIATAVGHTRVYMLRAPQNPTYPCVVIQRTDSDRWRSINSPSGLAQANIQIDVYAKDIYQAKDEAAKIETALDGYRNTVYYGGNSPQDFIRIAGITLNSDTDTLDQTTEDFLYRNLASYTVTYEQ